MRPIKDQKKLCAVAKAVRESFRLIAVAVGVVCLPAFISATASPAQPGNPGAQARQRGSGVHKPGPAYVILWFDAEDYVLPQSDDSAKRIAEFLMSQGIRATFKVVGEKARTLERRYREDVIAALDKQEIGYHSNYHSWRASPAEFEQPLNWQDGMQEFIRREQPDIDDIRRIFGRMPTAYGQPGSSWCPEAQPALRMMGIHVYLDDGEQVGLDGRPFWYGGILNIYDMKYINDFRPNDDWTNIAESICHFEVLRATKNLAGDWLMESRIIRLDRNVSLA